MTGLRVFRAMMALCLFWFGAWIFLLWVQAWYDIPMKWVSLMLVMVCVTWIVGVALRVMSDD